MLSFSSHTHPLLPRFFTAKQRPHLTTLDYQLPFYRVDPVDERDITARCQKEAEQSATSRVQVADDHTARETESLRQQLVKANLDLGDSRKATAAAQGAVKDLRGKVTTLENQVTPPFLPLNPHLSLSSRSPLFRARSPPCSRARPRSPSWQPR